MGVTETILQGFILALSFSTLQRYKEFLEYANFQATFFCPLSLFNFSCSNG